MEISHLVKTEAILRKIKKKIKEFYLNEEPVRNQDELLKILEKAASENKDDQNDWEVQMYMNQYNQVTIQTRIMNRLEEIRDKYIEEILEPECQHLIMYRNELDRIKNIDKWLYFSPPEGDWRRPFSRYSWSVVGKRSYDVKFHSEYKTIRDSCPEYRFCEIYENEKFANKYVEKKYGKEPWKISIKEGKNEFQVEMLPKDFIFRCCKYEYLKCFEESVDELISDTFTKLYNEEKILYGNISMQFISRKSLEA